MNVMSITFEPIPEWLLDELEEQIHAVLLWLKIPRRLDGFDYLTYAVMLSIQDPQCLKRITKELYPAVARLYRTDSSRTERSMRTAVGHSWRYGGREALDQMAGYHLTERPTNSEFIGLVVAYIRGG